jgi:hypothetical protein
MATNPISEETKVFTDVRNILNMVLPIISIIPLVPGDVKAKIVDV